ncbi:hypothetical protein E1B28_013636 [Marasmius oreades]|uniref:Uncharacterized protein n=1 Tax=Marasmius oreades TaxID=181124 RepID=A0A9P7RQ73_9AGAR|nr:uncharacterized protein E1B28_013636 [Marasmius oreades]KAG7087689.1 hypothetical protein E1B28_013636 [Marasmius oreades]
MRYTRTSATTPMVTTTDRSSTFSGDFDTSGGEHFHPGSNQHWTSQQTRTSTVFTPNTTRTEINPNAYAGTGTSTHNFADATPFMHPSNRGRANTMPWDGFFQNASNVRIGEVRFNYVRGRQYNTHTSNSHSRSSTRGATTIRNSYNVYRTTNIGSNNVVINGGSSAGTQQDVFESRTNDRRAERGIQQWNARQDNIDTRSPSTHRGWTTGSNTMIQNSYNVNQTTNIRTDNVVYHQSDLNPEISGRRSMTQGRGVRRWTFADAYPESVWEGTSQHHLSSYNDREMHYAGHYQPGSSVGVVGTSDAPPPPYPGGPDLVQSQWEPNRNNRLASTTASSTNTGPEMTGTSNASFATIERTEQESDSDADSDTESDDS